jgi:M6 family metalloprotease-like protein
LEGNTLFRRTLLLLAIQVAALLPAMPVAQAAVDKECVLSKTQSPYSLNEGPTDFRFFPKPRGDLRGIMLFVDFADAPAGGADTQTFVDLLVPGALIWLEEVSYAQASLTVAFAEGWKRMPDDSDEYGWGDGLSFNEQRTFLQDAADAADPDLDFSNYDFIYTVTPTSATDLYYSPAYVGGNGGEIQTDEGEIGFGVTFGQDIHSDDFGWRTFAHETGHLLSLPDLYDLTPDVLDYWLGTHPFAGGWDLMGWLGLGTHLTAWHKQKLNWLGPDQIRCVTTSTVISETLTPLDQEEGVKAVVIKTGPSTAVVVENRRAVGQDAQLCEEGLLVYRVNSQTASGAGPIQVVDAEASDEGMHDPCAPHWNAPFRSDEIDTFDDGNTEVRITGQVGDDLDVSVDYYNGPSGGDVDPIGGDDVMTNLTNARARPRKFSPNGDGRKDTTRLLFNLNEGARVSVDVRKKSGKLIKTLWEERFVNGGQRSVRWNGKKNGGGKAKPGEYRFAISAFDNSGNTDAAKAAVKIRGG